KKRRALFEHCTGDVLLRAASTVLDQAMADAMQPGPTAVRRIVRLLNQYFDRSDKAAEVLHLWTTHRFDAQGDRYAASFINVPMGEFELVVPQLRPEIRQAFPDFHPPYSVLRLKSSESVGLRIDRALLQTLISAEQGLPMPFRRGEPEA